MHGILPVAQAVAVGAVDTIENLAVNLRNKIVPRAPDRDARPLEGKTCLITGGNAGIGLATAKKLYQRGAHVILACRSPHRGTLAAEEVAALPPLPGCPAGSVEFMPLDLASLASVRDFCAAFNRRGMRLDALVCNAGIMSPPERQVTGDGLELQFQVNWLSHWLLAHCLVAEQRRQRRHQLGSLALTQSPAANTRGAARRRAAAAVEAVPLASINGAAAGVASSVEGQSEGVRLVIMSSLTHYAGSLQWDDKQSKENYSPFTSYAFTKMANIMTAAEFQRRFNRNPEWGADTAVALHPGIVNTGLAHGFFAQTGEEALPFGRYVMEPFLKVFMPLCSRSVEDSAASVLRAIVLPSDQVAGRYLHNDSPGRPAKFAQDEERAQELWDLAAEMTGVTTDRSLL